MYAHETLNVEIALFYSPFNRSFLKTVLKSQGWRDVRPSFLFSAHPEGIYLPSDRTSRDMLANKDRACKIYMK